MNRTTILNVRPLARAAVLGALLLGPACAAQAAPSTWEIDRAHSSITFKIRHLLARTSGSFGKFEGKIVVDADKRESVEATATIETASVDTDNTKRDDHLRGPDFFDATKFPTITFRGGKLSAVNADRTKAKLEGELTMHGVTKPVVLDVEWYGTAKDPWGNLKAAFAATTTVNRKDFGIIWNKTLDAGSYLLGDEVQVEISIEAQPAKDQATTAH